MPARFCRTNLLEIPADISFKTLEENRILNRNEYNILFQAYADDFPNCSSYEENEQSIQSLENYINQSLEIIFDWDKENGLAFSTETQ